MRTMKVLEPYKIEKKITTTESKQQRFTTHITRK